MSDRRVIVPFSDLSEYCEHQRPLAVKNWLQNNGILFFKDAEGRPCTTEHALKEHLKRGRRTRPNFPWEADQTMPYHRRKGMLPYSEYNEPRIIVPFSDLSELSARKRPTAVQKWLQAKGILYFLDADGRPCTTEHALNEALYRGRRTKPNWAAMDH